MAEKYSIYDYTDYIPSEDIVNDYLSAIPQNELLGSVSSGLRSAREFGNRATIPESIPLIGGTGVGDLILGESPEEVENWSYGNYPMYLPEYSGIGGYIPIMKGNRQSSLADTLFLGADVSPLIKPTTTSVNRFVQSLGKKLQESGVSDVAGEMVENRMRQLGALTDIVPPGPKPKPERIEARANEMGFYSPIEEAGLNLKRKSGSGQAFLNELKSNPNVKGTDLDWMGLTDFLSDKKNITREEVQQYINRNKIEFTEEVYKRVPVEVDMEQAIGNFPDLAEMPDVRRLIQEASQDWNPNNSYLSEWVMNDERAYEQLRETLIGRKQEELARQLGTDLDDLDADSEYWKQVESYIHDGELDDDMYQYLSELDDSVIDPAVQSVQELGFKRPMYKQYTFPEGIDNTEIAFRISDQAPPSFLKTLNGFPENYSVKEIPITSDGLWTRFVVFDEQGKPATVGKDGMQFGYSSEEQARELFARDYNSEVDATIEKYTDPFPSRNAHNYGDNTIAHLRFNTRLGPNNEKILLVEEMQSDWIQKGRQIGFDNAKDKQKILQVKTKLSDLNQKETRLGGLVEKARIKSDQLYKEVKQLHRNNYPDFGLAENSPEYKAYTEANTKLFKLREEFYTAQKERRSFQEKNKDLLNKSSIIKDAPESMKKGWYEAVLNRVMKIAVDEGFDQIALTRGRDQITRYQNISEDPKSVRTNVNRIDYKVRGDVDSEGNPIERFSITGSAPIPPDTDLGLSQNRESMIHFNDLSYKELKDLVGDDVAQMIREKGRTATYGTGTITESSITKKDVDNLSIGGKGMKRYYDEIYPETLEKLANKYDSSMSDSIIVGDDNISVRKIDVTPKMRYELGDKRRGGRDRGSPLFGVGGAGVGALSTLNQDNQTIPVMP